MDPYHNDSKLWAQDKNNDTSRFVKWLIINDTMIYCWSMGWYLQVANSMHIFASSNSGDIICINDKDF